MSLLLENDSFRLHLLHPVDDQTRLGARYVHGGYVWQMETAAGEKLFSGPRFRTANPTPYDGQGAPEAFRWYELLTERRLNLHGGRGLCPGLGLIEDIRELEPELLEAAPWSVERSRTACTMRSEATHGRQGYALVREVELTAGGFVSRTRIRNSGGESLEIHWFPHPFFPHAAPSVFWTPGFRLPASQQGYLQREADGIEIGEAVNMWGKTFQVLEGAPASDITVRLKHPVTGEAEMENHFDCAYLPIWCNRHTFSPEPHLTRPLEPGETAAWHLVYRFADF